MKWIRWQGFIPFVLTIGALIAAVLLFDDRLLKQTIETYGAELAGAEVNVGTAKITLSPLSFQIQSLQITDADKPSHNLVQIQKISGDLDLLRLFLGQTLVQRLEISGIKLDQVRSVPGRVLAKTKTSEEAESPRNSTTAGQKSDKALPKMQMDLPEVDEILAREPLRTVSLAEQSESLYQGEKQKLKAIEQQLPNSDKLKQYEEQLKYITKGKITSLQDFQQRQQEFKRLKKEIKQDKANLIAAKEQIKTSSQLLSEHIKALKEAPKQDFANLKQKYQFNDHGASNVSRLFFGDQAGLWTAEALYWYEKLKPFLEADEADAAASSIPRGEGRYIRFPEQNPMPDVLIANVRFSAEIERGPFSGEIQNITDDQSIQNKPTTYKLESNAIRGVDYASINGIYDNRQSGSAQHQLDYRFNNVQINDVELSGDDDLPLLLNSATLNLTGKGKIKNKQIKLNTRGQFSNSEFTSSADKGFAGEMALLLKQIQQFDINAEVSGSIQDPNITIKSNLDQQLKGAFSKRLNEKQKEFEQKLNQKLNKKLQQALAKQNINLENWRIEENNFQTSLKKLEDLAKVELKNYQDEQKRKLEEKKQQELERLKRKQKQEAKKLEEKLKNSLEDRLKEFKF